MQRIRVRTRIDSLSSEQRSSPIRWGRRIYFLILLTLVAIGLDWAVGDFVILRADGLVVAERTVSAATYAAKVSAVNVREGQHVSAGEIVAELQSTDMLRDIAQVSVQNADLTAKSAQLRSRLAVLESLIPLAERQARESAAVIDKLDKLSGTGLVTSERMAQALNTQYDGAARLAGLQAEAALLQTEAPNVERARNRATLALQQLEDFYDDGRIRAVRSGTIGTHVPAPGQVVRVGDELLQIFSGETSVLAYLPDDYLFPIRLGDRVRLSAGSVHAVGVIDALLTVADQLPPEFQSSFRPRDRSRLARIRVEGVTRPFAFSQKIDISGCAFGWCWM